MGVIVSLVASPKSTLPFTVRFPVTVAFSSTCKVSTFAVPSMNKSLNSNPLAPKSDPASDAGSIFPVIVAPAPTIRAPPVVTIPANAALPVEE